MAIRTEWREHGLIHRSKAEHDRDSDALLHGSNTKGELLSTAQGIRVKNNKGLGDRVRNTAVYAYEKFPRRYSLNVNKIAADYGLHNGIVELD